jgi:hypothetical protein
MQDKQHSQQLTAVNAPTTETEQSIMRGISMEINYSPLTLQDETKTGLYSGNTKASFNSFKEVQAYLNRISDVNNKTLNAAARTKRDQKYRVTTKLTRKGFSLTIPDDEAKDITGLSKYERTNNNTDDYNYSDELFE